MQSSGVELDRSSLQKLELDGDKLQKGLAKLVLTVIELLRQILERQAQRRIESGSLTTEEVERLGLAFLQIKETMNQLSEKFGFDPGEVGNALTSLVKSGNSQLGKTSLVDVIDKLLTKGVVVGGRITVSVADVDLVALDLLAMLSGLPDTPNHKGGKVDG
jgi:hypothetical protein